jgi:dTDP-glucose 4,6-dehydratase
MRQAIAGKPLTVFGDGSQTRSFCYVDDLIDGLWRLASSGEHTPVNIGNPCEMTLLELAQEIVAVTGSASEIVFSALPLDDPKIRRPDIAKAKRILEWEPKISLREGLEKLYAYECHWVSHSMTGLEYEKPTVQTVPADEAAKILAEAEEKPAS